MTLIDINLIQAPISESMPIGEDIAYDDDFLALKNRRLEEDEKNLGDWVEVKDEAKVTKSTLELASDLLTKKSKNLQVVAFLIEELVKQNGFDGLKEGLEVLSSFCQNFLKTCYPLTDEKDFFESRSQTFFWMDEKITLALRVFHLFAENQFEGISFDEIEKLNKIGLYASTRNVNNEDDEQTEKHEKIESNFQRFLSTINEANIQEKILFPIELVKEKIKNLHNLIKNDLDLGNNFFSNLISILDSIQSYFKTLKLPSKAASNKLENSRGNKTDNNTQYSEDYHDDSDSEVADNFSLDRNLIYRKIEKLGKNLLMIDRHSPVPHFIFKILSWKEKSFIEIIPELGMNSPLLEFIKQAHSTKQNSNENDDDQHRRRKSHARDRRSYMDLDDDDD